MTSVERRSVVVATHRDFGQGLKAKLIDQLEEYAGLQIPGFCRIEITDIGSQIAPKRPDIVLIIAQLTNREEANELRGFVSKVKKRLPTTTLVVQSTDSDKLDREALFGAGADAWIDDRLAYPLLAHALEQLAIGNQLIHEYIKRNPLHRK